MNLKLDSEGNLIIGRGFGRVSGTDYVAQLVGNRLKVVLGESSIYPKAGIPWFSNILTANPNLRELRSWVSSIILETNGVKSLTTLSIDFDREERKANIYFEAKSIYGNISRSVEV